MCSRSGQVPRAGTGLFGDECIDQAPPPMDMGHCKPPRRHLRQARCTWRDVITVTFTATVAATCQRPTSFVRRGGVRHYGADEAAGNDTPFMTGSSVRLAVPWSVNTPGPPAGDIVLAHGKPWPAGGRRSGLRYRVYTLGLISGPPTVAGGQGADHQSRDAYVCSALPIGWLVGRWSNEGHGALSQPVIRRARRWR